MEPQIEAATETAIEPTELSEQSKQRKRLERRWFWIALLPMASLFLYLGSVAANFTGTTRLPEALIWGPGFALVIAALLGAPPLIKRLGIFASSRKFRVFGAVTATVGIAAYAAFFVCVSPFKPTETDATPPAVLCIALIYITLLALSAYASVVLHKAVRIVSVKQAGVFSGWMTVLYIAAFLVVSAFLVVFNRWIVFYFTETIIYAIPLIISLVLLFGVSCDDDYAAPKTATYFSDALYVKFMVAAALLLLLDMFHDGSYYGGGTYSAIFELWQQVAVWVMPLATGFAVIALIRKNLWFPAILATILLICFEQGLVLFFNDSETLALAYAISSSLISSCPLILAFFIPLAYSAQRRGSAITVTGAMAFWLFGTVLNTLIAFVSDKLGGAVGIVMLVKPAVTFTLSIAAIAYLFYLYSENNRVYIAGLIAEFKSRKVEEVHETVSKADLMEGLGLTPREKEVCALLLKSLSVKMIAVELGLAFSTVNGYYRSLYRKLNISSKGELFMRFGADSAALGDETA